MQIYHLFLCHILFTYFIVQMLYSFMIYFQCFSSPFPVFIIMSICAHSHGSVNHWWHSSQSINGYMVTSTKIWYLGSLCSFYAIHVSVIWGVTWCLYRLFLFANHECDILCCFMGYVVMSQTYIELMMLNFWAYMICICCVRGQLYINVHVYLYITMVFLLWYIVSVWYFIFLMFQHSSVLCYCMEYWYDIWYILF